MIVCHTMWCGCVMGNEQQLANSRDDRQTWLTGRIRAFYRLADWLAVQTIAAAILILTLTNFSL